MEDGRDETRQADGDTPRTGSETGAAISSLGAALRRDAARGWKGTEGFRARVGAGVRGGAGRIGGVARRAVSRRPDGRRPRWPLYTLGALAGLAVLAVVFLTALTVWAIRDLPLSQVLPAAEEPALVLETADGTALLRRGGNRAPYAALDEFPQHLQDAVLAVEDRRFYEHSGVDPRGILRAAVRNWRAGGVVEGGSTLTQQLVKVLYLDDTRTLRRKAQEAVIARNLDRQLGKERILELYLNSIYLGAGASGVPAASEVLFGIPHSELTLPQSALLAASISAPSRLNLRTDPEAARERAALVLRLMADQGRIDEATARQATDALAGITARPRAATTSEGDWQGAWFADWMLPQAEAIAEEIAADVTVTATLDPRIQALAQTALTEGLAELPEADGAIVVMDAEGRVRAMVGGRDPAGEFNRATQAQRQPGSTFKLFTYAVALGAGVAPDDRVRDQRVEVDGWAPQNFSGEFRGVVTLREAFAASLNGAAAGLALELGLDNVAETARAFGFEGELPEVPALSLGTSETTLLDMTEAYAAVLAGRAPIEATGIARIALGEGGPAYEIATGPGGTLQPEVRDGLADLLAAVVSQGTGRNAAWGGPVAGKTGTSQDSRDAWFIGFSDQLVIGVWIGRDDNAPLGDASTGGGRPAQIFSALMTGASEGLTPDGPAARAAALALPDAQAAAAAAAAPQCNVRACSRFYRSFRASDCTFQPYSGPRRRCTR
ncbi:transglycosylase domain-containing protein [Roseobacter sp. HKCCA0434]|uniref:transglycosylase domain-containing protein n=1 Tax=Roseobacter sp. HKCCA0434 TaxID=3079297 RepID=UPI002905916A|nr:transglycosylase domain-containing protein [Roseobacter sp. HKCCA0434]